MVTEIKFPYISFIVLFLSVIFGFMIITSLISVGLQGERIIEYNSGTITVKWKVDKLLNDWYRFEIDNITILEVNDYTWYKYNVGDTYNWTERYWDYPDDLWIWW